ISVMTFAFARIGATVAMRVEDYYPKGKRWWVRLHEKGGKRHEMPAHHNLEAYLEALSDQMLAAPLTVVGLGHEQSVPIFQQLAGGHPSGRDDVREIPAVATQRRGSPGRAGDRHQP